MKRKTMLELQNVMFSAQKDKLNWLPLTGTCLFTDKPSDGIPSGGLDKPVRFPTEEVDKSMATMNDMGIDCEWPDDFWDGTEDAFSGHDDRFKIGVVKSTTRKDNEMVISGGLWCNDFADICSMYTSAKASLGFSVEVYFNVIDRGEYYDATDIEFTGVAILFSNLAAFKDTYIAAKAKQGGISNMTKEEMKELLDAQKVDFSAQVEKLTKQIEDLAVGFAEDRDARKKAEEKAQAELAEKQKIADEEAKKAAELEAAQQKEAEEKAKADLAAKQKEADVKRKSLENGIFKSKFGTTEADEILKNDKMSPSDKFQALLKDTYK